MLPIRDPTGGDLYGSLYGWVYVLSIAEGIAGMQNSHCDGALSSSNELKDGKGNVQTMKYPRTFLIAAVVALEPVQECADEENQGCKVVVGA